MNKKLKWHQSLLNALMDASKAVSEDFSNKQPVDNIINKYFRANKYLGSRDRRLIGNAIFGFYRWYGWLKNIDEKKESSLPLLLGYILDHNPITSFVEDWIREMEKKTNLNINYKYLSGGSINEKLSFMKQYLPDCCMEQLVPTCTPTWVLDQINFLQKRPNIWLRSTQDGLTNLITFLNEQKIPFEAHPQIPLAVEVMKPFNIHECRAFKKGKVEVQDISSQIIGLICNPDKKDVWWDVCAGSGGKSLHLSSLTKGQVKIFATDIRKKALNELKKRVNRNWRNIFPIAWDGIQKVNFPTKITHAIVDAPCSCSGTWRRNPEIRWQFDPESLKQFSEIQYGILKMVAENYPDIETIVYATCSFFPEENEHVIEKFLQMFSEFELFPITNPLSPEEKNNGFMIAPPMFNGNFMYAAVLKRK